MTNLDKAKELLEQIYGEPYYAQIILVNRVKEILDIAAQPDWHFTYGYTPIELPETDNEVLAEFAGIGYRLVSYKNGFWYMNEIKLNVKPVKWMYIK